MSRLIVVAAAVFLAVVTAGAWLMLRPGGPPPNASAPADMTTAIGQALEAAKEGGAVIVGPDGKKVSAGFSLPGVPNVDTGVNVSNNNVNVSVTLKDPEPQVITPASFEKIKEGMTYTEAADALGPPMTKGRLSEGYSGGFTLAQGTRKLNLTFQDGKVTKKSAEGLE